MERRLSVKLSLFDAASKRVSIRARFELLSLRRVAWALGSMLRWCPMTSLPGSPGRALLLALSLSFVGTACKEEPREPTEPAARAEPSRSAPARAKPRLTRRSDPAAPLEQFVQQRVERAQASGARVLVYVGASWCEPCRRFHRALEAGELDDVLAGTEFVEFDAERDRAELFAAGYGSKYIPLFSVPDPSGHASGRAIEGSIEGDRAVRADLVPRLLALLDGKPVE